MHLAQMVLGPTFLPKPQGACPPSVHQQAFVVSGVARCCSDEWGADPTTAVGRASDAGSTKTKTKRNRANNRLDRLPLRQSLTPCRRERNGCLEAGAGRAGFPAGARL